jgi:hypothetical protein
MPAATTTTTVSSSPASLSTNSASPITQYIPPTQLSEVVDALTCLQKKIAVLSSRPEGPTSHEVAKLAAEPCESIIRDLRAAIATHDACMRSAERLARAEFGAEMMAFLHVSKL